MWLHDPSRRARRLGAPCIPVHNWQKVPLRAAGALRLAKSRRKAAVARMHARCGSRRGGTSPPLANHPRRGCSRVPATANKFVHILWKNLICDNVAAVGFFACPRGRGCWRCETCAYRFREGNAPAGCRYAGAQCAPLRVTDAAFGAPSRGSAHFGAPRSWPRIHLLAPYGVAAVNGTRTVLGWQPIPCLSQWQPGGRGKASLTFARAARPEGRGGDSQEAGGTLVPPPLVRLSRAATPFPPPAGGEIFRP